MPAVVAEASAGTDGVLHAGQRRGGRPFADVDLFVTYGDADGAIVGQLQADPLLSQIPADRQRRDRVLENSTPLAASANPSPLSIGWGIDDYFALLAGARCKST